MYLNCHSWYSLRYGSLKVEELVKAASDKNINCLALTDINNVTGIFDFTEECRKAGIKPLAGIEFRNENKYLYIGIAKNNKGFQELNEFLTEHNLSGNPLPKKGACF